MRRLFVGGEVCGCNYLFKCIPAAQAKFDLVGGLPWAFNLFNANAPAILGAAICCNLSFQISVNVLLRELYQTGFVQHKCTA